MQPFEQKLEMFLWKFVGFSIFLRTPFTSKEKLGISCYLRYRKQKLDNNFGILTITCNVITLFYPKTYKKTLTLEKLLYEI